MGCSLAGTLRYDLSADHSDCPEHDEHMARKIARIHTKFANKAANSDLSLTTD